MYDSFGGIPRSIQKMRILAISRPMYLLSSGLLLIQFDLGQKITGLPIFFARTNSLLDNVMVSGYSVLAVMVALI